MWTFENTEVAAAPSAAVWDRWIAVGDWPKQNPTLKSATLRGSFSEGARINLVPKRGPKSSLVVSDVVSGTSFTGVGKIPFGELRIEHGLTPGDGPTSFTHRIVVTGPLAKVFGSIVGRQLAAALPGMMKIIAAEAESASAK